MDNNIIRISEIFDISSSKPYINDVIDSNWISYTGKYVKLCEDIIKKLLNVKHVLLTNNGTSATHCVIKSIKFKYPNCNKIYIPDHCYIAVYNSVLYEYNKEQIEILPIDKNTWNLDLNYIDNIEPNSCLVVVHNLGNIIPINKIKTKRPDIIIVEDNCEGFMGKYDNIYSGSNTLSSSISFFANKHITSAEGGAFITNDDDVYKYIKSFCTQGLTDQKYIHNIVAHNYKYNNLLAALLYSQFDKLNYIYNKKKELYNIYTELFKNYSDKITLQHIEPNTIHSYWIFGIKFNNGYKDYKNIEEYFLNNNIEIRPFFYNYKNHLHLSDIICNNDLNMDKQIILLPLHCYLTRNDIIYIVEKTISYLYKI
jgi:perosamine synthetase